jgi:hypothetical protein
MKHLVKFVTILAISLGLFTSCQKDAASIINNYLTPPLADAGNGGAIQLPASSYTLHGTGTSYNGPISGYLWSLISGPSVPTIESPSSASTKISNMIAGTYRFQFAVIDSAGLTGVDTTSITVTTGSIKTLTLQPGNNPNELHMALWGSITESDPSAPEFNAAAWTKNGISYLTRGLFKFDLSAIPANSTILSAKLTLYSNPTPINGNQIDANFGSANAMYIERNASPWNATTVNWNTQPTTDITSQILIPHTNLPLLDLVDIDVKNLVAVMTSSNNYGFKIRLQNETIYNIRNFCSSKYADASKHPKLVITYQ